MTPEQRKQRFYTLVILIPIAVGLLWLIVGAFSYLLGFDTAYASGEPIFEITGVNSGQYWGKAGSYDRQRISQEWTPQIDAEICEISIELSKKYSPTDDLKLTIYRGDVDPESGVNLGYVVVPNAQIPATAQYVSFEFDPCVLVDADVKHHFTTIRTGDLDSSNFYRVGYRNTSEYVYTQWWGYAPGSGGWNISEPDTEQSFRVYGTLLYPEQVWAVSPASESEITSLEDTFTFAWQGLQDWDTLSVVFQNQPTGLYTGAQEYIIEVVSPSGQIALSFDNFSFDRNGIWHFYAVASRYGIEFIEGMFITGRYSYEWSEDLVDPETWYTINIDGFQEIFGMSDFETWYGINAKFDEPTPMFLAIAGFFEPIFSLIGEFGNRITDYFNVNESYGQGYEIGRTIAYFSYFLDEVSLFLGGFPLLIWLLIIILILVGFFIFRLVLKFIPFLGGS